MSNEGKRFPFSHCDQEEEATPKCLAACCIDQLRLRLKFTNVSWKLLQNRAKSSFEVHPLEVESISRESNTSRLMSQIPLFNRANLWRPLNLSVKGAEILKWQEME